mmetsp:Transcript_1601/g.3059  ORF Transcript_1601/g.3059 Transcript_1601/m.3059 type:complete len:84 (+) Transcript_1601:195-446(+)
MVAFVVLVARQDMARENKEREEQDMVAGIELTSQAMRHGQVRCCAEAPPPKQTRNEHMSYVHVRSWSAQFVSREQDGTADARP